MGATPTFIGFLALVLDANADPPQVVPTLEKETASHLVTIDDVIAVRKVDTLSLSPNGLHFAILVRQADAKANGYSSGWFVGNVRGGQLTPVGDGGDIWLDVLPTGHIVGDFASVESRWSSNGQWIVYKRRRNGEIQLWRSRIDGGRQEQITHNSADVFDFAFGEDGNDVFYTVGTPRTELRVRDEVLARNGYRYNEDLYAFTDFMDPEVKRSPEANLSIWSVDFENKKEHRADSLDREKYERLRRHDTSSLGERAPAYGNPAVSLVRADGALLWLARLGPLSIQLSVNVLLPHSREAITCPMQECSGSIRRVWWSNDGEHVLIWRGEGLNGDAHGFYSWSPTRGTLALVLRSQDDDFRNCERSVDDLVCIRETTVQPAQVVTIDCRSGAVKVVADVNPEWRTVRLGKVERFEWDTPKFSWNEPGGRLAGLYPNRAYGYVLYPPDFDPAKIYPVFVDPYLQPGFDNFGEEHALHVYAASGFIVLKTAFPDPNSTDALSRLRGAFVKELYSADLDFPHLTMLMESTLRALDKLEAQEFVDRHRVGIGGVSHGTFIPLYMMQKHGRIAAISISSPTWGPHEYYWVTRKGRAAMAAVAGEAGYEDWEPKPEGEGAKFWKRIDIADHIDAVDAPILMNLAASETYALIRFIRHLTDAGKPYDAYVFPRETHLKWQPAHRYAIYNRNLDWFRFWLQGIEDPNPSKIEQYRGWRQLREMLRANPSNAAEG